MASYRCATSKATAPTGRPLAAELRYRRAVGTGAALLPPRQHGLVWLSRFGKMMANAPPSGSRLWAALLLVLAGLAIWTPAPAQRSAPPLAVELTIEGAIGPATAEYFGRGVSTAQARGAALVLLRVDTPGGLDTSMRQIVRDILASPVPVVTYVAPSGARAASAGTFIAYASHVAAMAPGTNLGAATPVSIGGGGMPGAGEPERKEPGDTQTSPAAAPRSASEAKAVNDAVAYLRALAELRGRNADWAELAVREGASLSSDQALASGVIDVQARTTAELLERLDGRRVTAAGHEIVVRTQGMSVEPLAPGWRTRLLSAITDPNVALILMMIGIYGLLFEFMNPGAIYPGTIGAICLLTALYAFSALPVDYAGAGLLLLGIGLMIAEGFAPSFGVLGIGGALAFALGAAILIDPDIPGFQIAWQVIAGLVVVSLLGVIAAVRVALRARRRAVVTGRDQMIGAVGVVQDWSDRRGHIFIHSERWNAASDGTLGPGAQVRVVGMEGLTLRVEPAASAIDERNA